MGRHALNLVLAVAVVVTAGLAWRRSGKPQGPAWEYFPNMARTVRYNSFESNPNFADGSTLRVPPAGTVARGLPPLARAAGAPEPVNPFAPTDARALERGTVVFSNFCRPCHGPEAKGDGLVVQHGFPAPPSLVRPRTRALTDAAIFQLITNGRGGMAAYGAQVSRDDRWKVILYLRTLQQRADQAPAAAQ